MRKVEENKEQEQEGIELTIEEEVQIGEDILEEGDKVVIYPANPEEETTENEETSEEE